jgi:hypothetical protein
MKKLDDDIKQDFSIGSELSSFYLNKTGSIDEIRKKISDNGFKFEEDLFDVVTNHPDDMIEKEFESEDNFFKTDYFFSPKLKFKQTQDELHIPSNDGPLNVNGILSKGLGGLYVKIVKINIFFRLIPTMITIIII